MPGQIPQHNHAADPQAAAVDGWHELSVANPTADGDAIADPPDAAAAEPLRPASTDRAIGMMAGLDALPPLLTVAEAAEVLRVGRSWVYEHAAEIGAVKLGSGQTAPLRIPREGVWRIVGTPPPRRDRRSVASRRARKAETSNGDLRARPRM